MVTGPYNYQLSDLREFVHRDQCKVFSTYFETVRVIPKWQTIANESYWAMDVKVDDVRIHDQVIGGLRHAIVEMGWGIGLRTSGQEEYMVSFAGTGHSRNSEEGTGQMIESGVSGLIKHWTDDKILKKLKETEAEFGTPNTDNSINM